MKIDVYIREVATGEVRIYKDKYQYPETEEELGNIQFQWGENNYSCDCNRALFFYDWKEPECDISCSEGKFAVDKITNRETGEILFADL